MSEAQSDPLRELAAQVQLREQQLRAVFDCALDAMLLADDQARYLDANPAALALLALSRERLLGMSVGDVMGQPAEATAAAWQEFLRVGHSEGEVNLQRQDGSRLIVEFRATAHIVPGLHLSVMRDITERRGAEETRLRMLSEQRSLESRLAIADRMFTVGTLAAGIAHEINNPIMAVVANLELAQQELNRLAQGAMARNLEHARLQIGRALEGTERVTNIVRDVKLLSRVTEPRRAAVDLHRVLESAVRIASNEIRHRARVVRDYGSIPLIAGDESRLGQVFLNLLINAAQAIPEGRADNHEICLRTRHNPGRGRVEIDVEDTGSGFAPGARDRLFTPFFTTRPEGHGTGLGLAICRRIVAEQGGEIVALDAAERTVFRVSLPISEAPTENGGGQPAIHKSPARRGRVLIVDDDLSICRSIEYYLKAEHEVTVFDNARQALSVLREGSRFDVILCDLMMPVMTGMELHNALHGLDPVQAERMVFLTGGAFTADAQSFLEQVANERLEKPVSLKVLGQLVARKLAELTP